jgi:hypothetical protein
VQTRGSTDELTQLFNLMLKRNEGLVTAVHESLDYVAHDLHP